VLTAAIAALSEKHQTIVVLRDVEGLSPQEIAQITGLSVANVKVRTHRARRELRRRLEAFMSGPLAFAARASVTPTDTYRSDALQPTARRAASNQTSPRSVLKVSGEGEPRRATHRREETARSVRDDETDDRKTSLTQPRGEPSCERN
jgi:hypothetical protein